MNNPTAPQLSESEVESIEEAIRRELVISHPGLILQFSALIRDWRALKADRTQLIGNWESCAKQRVQLQTENTVLREQLAQLEQAVAASRDCDRCAPLLAVALREQP